MAQQNDIHLEVKLTNQGTRLADVEGVHHLVSKFRPLLAAWMPSCTRWKDVPEFSDMSSDRNEAWSYFGKRNLPSWQVQRTVQTERQDVQLCGRPARKA